MDQIIITFPNGRGHMTVVLDEFFPTSTLLIRKLLKVIDEDPAHRDELRAVVVQHCSQRAQALLASQTYLVNQGVNYYKQATRMQPEIDSLTRQIDALQQYIDTYCKRGFSQGYRQQLKGLKAQLKAAKEQRRQALALFRDCQRKLVSLEKNAERLKKNAEVANYGN